MEKAKVDILSGLWSRGLMSQRRQPRLQAAAQEARIAALAEEAVEAGIKWSQALSFIMMQRRRTGFDWLSGADERLLITAVHAIGELMDRRGISFEETLQMIAAIRSKVPSRTNKRTLERRQSERLRYFKPLIQNLTAGTIGHITIAAGERPGETTHHFTTWGLMTTDLSQPRIAALAEEAAEAGVTWDQAKSFVMMQRKRTGLDMWNSEEERLLIKAVHSLDDLMVHYGIPREEALQMVASLRCPETWEPVSPNKQHPYGG
uniref:Uncharacterized protein n=1 Tax=Branchiostoma floridae TaxID=7739 RepID=C3Z6A3_BRAFL|eukprot:XP_002595926.1 hypothetical protein BRAFLDRAFT_98545 [Branchiostoma floridae]